MVATYDNLGVRFSYPESWQVSDESESGWPKAVTLDAPDGAGFWSVSIHFPPVEPEVLAREILAAVRSENPEADADPVFEEIELVETNGFDAHYFYLDLIVVIRIRAFRIGSRTFATLCQAEDRDMDRYDDVFKAISVSMIRDAISRSSA